MIDLDELSWRTFTELIRHITFVFVVAFIIAVFKMGFAVGDLLRRALMFDGISNIFCSVIVFSVPIYVICIIVDSIDAYILGDGLGLKILFPLELCRRIFYDATYVIFYFNAYIIVFIILVVISAVGLIFLL